MKELMPKNLERAKFVKKERLARAWPQSQLAIIAGVNLRTIQRIEKDGAASLETLQGIAQAFEIDVKELDPSSSSKSNQEKAKSQKSVYLLPRLTSGKSLSDVVVGSDQFQIEHDEDYDKRSIASMKDILELLKSDVVRLYDADPIKRLSIEEELSQELKGLENYGYYLFGMKRMIPGISGKKRTEVTMCTLYMSHSRSPRIVSNKNLSMFIPAVLPETAKLSQI